MRIIAIPLVSGMNIYLVSKDQVLFLSNVESFGRTVQSKGKLNNGLDYAAGFSLEFDGADMQGSATQTGTANITATTTGAGRWRNIAPRRPTCPVMRSSNTAWRWPIAGSVRSGRRWPGWNGAPHSIPTTPPASAAC